MRIDLHIGELLLHGIAPDDRDGIAADVERELARLFAEGGAPAALSRGGAFHLEGASVVLPAGTAPGEIGTHVARQAYSRIVGGDGGSGSPGSGGGNG